MSRQRNVAQIKEQNKTPEKDLNKNGDKQCTKYRVQNTVISLLKELSEDLNSIKKI